MCCTNLTPGMDNIDTECIHSIPANVISVDPGDKDLTLVVVTKEAAYHVCGGCVLVPVCVRLLVSGDTGQRGSQSSSLQSMTGPGVTLTKPL